MEITNVVFKQEFDETTLEQLRTLRATRLTLAENMLSELAKTADEIKIRGLQDDVDMEELRIELTDRIATMRARIDQPNTIFEDEILLYSDLLAEGAPRD